MKRLLLGTVAFATLGMFSAAANAQFGPSSFYQHEQFHDELEHRDFHRELDHRDAHRYPMTWSQHERLHDALDHEAYHDQLDHREYHRSQPARYGGYGGYPGAGFGYSGRGFSIWFGGR